MAKCEACLHNEVCKYGENRCNGLYCTGEKCKQFKDRTKYVEVVLCKDCKYFGTDGCAFDTYAFDVVEEGFCSYGERREGE